MRKLLDLSANVVELKPAIKSENLGVLGVGVRVGEGQSNAMIAKEILIDVYFWSFCSESIKAEVD